MNFQQTLTIVASSLGLLLLTLELIRRNMLREKYALAWLFIGASMLLSPFVYSYAQRIGEKLGIVDTRSLYFLLAILGLLLLSLQFSLALTTAFTHRRMLTQRVALLDQRVRELEDRLAANASAAAAKPPNDDAAPRP